MLSEKELFKRIIRLGTVIDTLEELWQQQTLSKAQSLALLMLYDEREIARNEYRRVAESEAGI
jgi:hypothetical protein